MPRVIVLALFLCAGLSGCTVPTHHAWPEDYLISPSSLGPEWELAQVEYLGGGHRWTTNPGPIANMTFTSLPSPARAHASVFVRTVGDGEVAGFALWYANETDAQAAAQGTGICEYGMFAAVDGHAVAYVLGQEPSSYGAASRALDAIVQRTGATAVCVPAGPAPADCVYLPPGNCGERGTEESR